MKRDIRTKTDSGLTLLLVRHGKAAPKDIGISDFDRSLTSDGAAECAKIARKISRKKLSLDLMISSPADRALETAHIFARELEYSHLKIQIARVIYSAGNAASLFALLKKIGQGPRAVAVFGHNPTLEMLALRLLSGFAENLPKGASLGISFTVKSWAQIAPGSGKMLFLEKPKTTDREKGHTGRADQ